MHISKLFINLNELNESNLSEELEKRNDGQVEIIDVRLNSRKTKSIDPNSKMINFYCILKLTLTEKD